MRWHAVKFGTTTFNDSVDIPSRDKFILFAYSREYPDMLNNIDYLVLIKVERYSQEQIRVWLKLDCFYGNSTLYILWVVFDVYRCNNCVAYIRKRWVSVEEFHISIRVGLEEILFGNNHRTDQLRPVIEWSCSGVRERKSVVRFYSFPLHTST